MSTQSNPGTAKKPTAKRVSSAKGRTAAKSSTQAARTAASNADLFAEDTLDAVVPVAGTAPSSQKADAPAAAATAQAPDAEGRAARAARGSAKTAEPAPPDIASLKADVRREALTRRQQLRPATRSNRSRDICNQLLSELQASRLKGRGGQPPTIAVYAALRFEVDLDRFIRGAYAFGHRIVFPCMMPNERASGGMCMRSVSCPNYISGGVPFIVDPRKPWGPAVTEEHQMTASVPVGSGRRFIPSRSKGSVPPKDDMRFPVVSPAEIDLIVVPMAAFDAEGRRLGYGSGVYDRFLPQLREDCRVLGVAYAEQEVTEVPCEPHDVPLEKIITA